MPIIIINVPNLSLHLDNQMIILMDISKAIKTLDYYEAYTNSQVKRESSFAYSRTSDQFRSILDKINSLIPSFEPKSKANDSWILRRPVSASNIPAISSSRCLGRCMADAIVVYLSATIFGGIVSTSIGLLIIYLIYQAIAGASSDNLAKKRHMEQEPLTINRNFAGFLMHSRQYFDDLERVVDNAVDLLTIIYH